MTDEPTKSLRVEIQDSSSSWLTVGILHHRQEISWFETEGEYWETPQRPVLGQIFEERGAKWHPSQRVSLPNWFSHLLPEGYIREAVADALHVNAKREFFLLSRLGLDDLPGAIRVVPEEGVLAGQTPSHSDDGQTESPGEEVILKFSLAGVQPKFSVLEDSRKGLTIPARGQAGDWIVKLPDSRPGFDNVPEAEFASMELARSIGIPVPETRLIPLSDIGGLPDWARKESRRSFAIQRFDRAADGGRIHAEVLAQVLDVPTTDERYKYQRANVETISSLISGLCGADAVADVIDRVVLNVIIGNGDAHLKNWAIVYPDTRKPQLSPVFDVLPTVLYLPEDDLGPKLNGNKNFGAVSLSSFERLARRSFVEYDQVRSRVLSAVERIQGNWSLLKELLVADQYDRLTRRKDSLLLVRDALTART
ncbi:type II toxin-antitoxin system HipA family toxin [Streptomyces collinus]|uniref:type II toxin-antitoxin system HipA family toxin n=1 Tax=Streptomyces collinus TaxID=42684 RepID=UPI0033C063AF